MRKKSGMARRRYMRKPEDIVRATGETSSRTSGVYNITATHDAGSRTWRRPH